MDYVDRQEHPRLQLTIVFFVEFFEARKPALYIRVHLVLAGNGALRIASATSWFGQAHLQSVPVDSEVVYLPS